MEDIEERKFGDLTIRIDRGRCIGTAACVKIAPEVFELDSQRVCAFGESPGKIDRDRLIEACAVCPVDALIVIDAGGRQIVPGGR